MVEANNNNDENKNTDKTDLSEEDALDESGGGEAPEKDKLLAAS